MTDTPKRKPGRPRKNNAVFQALTPEQLADVERIVRESGAPRSLVESLYHQSLGRPSTDGGAVPAGRETTAAASQLLALGASRAGTRDPEAEAERGVTVIEIVSPYREPCERCGHVKYAPPGSTMDEKE